MLLEEDVVVFDAYAWVEYALDSPKAERVARMLESSSEAFTPASVLAELKESMLRHGFRRSLIRRVLTFVGSRTIITEIDAEIAEVAGETNFKQKKKVKNWCMLDSFVLAVAIVKGGRVLTGDPHFKDMNNVTYIGE
jgi:predicted nucleic acid-binding protein